MGRDDDEARGAVRVEPGDDLGVEVLGDHEPGEAAAEVAQVKKFESGMVVNPVTIGPKQTLADALDIMSRHRISGIPIVENGNHVAFRHGIVQLDPQFPDHTGGRRRHFHGGLVAFQGNKRIFCRNSVAHFYMYFDNWNVGEIANIRYRDLGRVSHSVLLRTRWIYMTLQITVAVV